MKKTGVFVLLAGIAGIGCTPETPVAPGSDSAPRSPAKAVTVSSPVVDADRLVEHIKVLASDEFEGRGVASDGERLTVEYIAQAFRDAGLQPAFGDSYFQEVPLVEATATPETDLVVAGGRESLRFSYPGDVVAWTRRLTDVATLQSSELVFVGYGTVAPEYGWDDYEGLDVSGKTVVMLVNDPGFATADPTLFRGREMTYYGRWTYKFEEAARQGARGAIVIHETEAAAYPWAVVVSSWTGPRFDLRTVGGNADRVEVEAWISTESANRLFEAAGQDLSALRIAAASPDFEAVPLGLQASLLIDNRMRDVISRNVVGWLPGSQRPEETILFSAHWDHLGRDPGLAGDQIYNGAADNATGVAALLEQARVLAAAPEPAPRSFVFAAFTAEESTLLGSLHFAQQSPFPLETMVGVLNTDRMNHLGATRDIQVRGYGSSELEGYLAAAAARQDRTVVPEAFPERGLYFRSDHFSFARYGVPGLHVRSGIDYVAHGKAWGREKENEYTTDHYHKPSDEYAPDWDLGGAALDAELYVEVARVLAGESRFPAWSEGSEFRAIRAESVARRSANP